MRILSNYEEKDVDIYLESRIAERSIFVTFENFIYKYKKKKKILVFDICLIARNFYLSIHVVHVLNDYFYFYAFELYSSNPIEY